MTPELHELRVGEADEKPRKKVEGQKLRADVV
jgi:hypothetical protein